MIIGNVIKGLEIVVRYVGEEAFAVNAEHDVVYAGPASEFQDALTEEDAQELRNLGWHYDEELDVWKAFV